MTADSNFDTFFVQFACWFAGRLACCCPLTCTTSPFLWILKQMRANTDIYTVKLCKSCSNATLLHKPHNVENIGDQDSQKMKFHMCYTWRNIDLAYMASCSVDVVNKGGHLTITGQKKAIKKPIGAWKKHIDVGYIYSIKMICGSLAFHSTWMLHTLVGFWIYIICGSHPLQRPTWRVYMQGTENAGPGTAFLIRIWYRPIQGKPSALYPHICYHSESKSEKTKQSY